MQREAEGRTPPKTDPSDEEQIIVSADVTDQAIDSRQAQPMFEQALENLDDLGVDDKIKAFTADAGYYSDLNATHLESGRERSR